MNQNVVTLARLELLLAWRELVELVAEQSLVSRPSQRSLKCFPVPQRSSPTPPPSPCCHVHRSRNFQNSVIRRGLCVQQPWNVPELLVLECRSLHAECVCEVCSEWDVITSVCTVCVCA